MSDGYLVTFTDRELRWADHMAEEQLKDWKRSGARYTMDTTPEIKLWASRIGARGEIAVAKRYDLLHPFLMGDYLRRFAPCPDFGPRSGPGLCIHATAAEIFPRIPVRKNDGSDNVFILVVEFSPGVSRIHAWCWGKDAKKHEPLTNPKPFGNVKSVPAHFVGMHSKAVWPEKILGTFPWPGTEVPAEILALCPKGYRVP